MRANGRKIRGFTLVELIVVVTVLAVLATVGFLSLSGYSDDARSASLKANVRTVYSAILTESTTSGNSPRWYVEHSPSAALSGAFVFVDGANVALTGGDVGGLPADSNYTAGNPRWDRLRMSADKFRIASFRSPILSDDASAGYSTGMVSVGAVDVPKAGISGRKRNQPLFQVAAVLPSNGMTTVTGNFTPQNSGAAGLVRSPWSSVGTLALGDGGTALAGDPKSCLDIKNANPLSSDGTYSVDPDGSGGNPPISVTCDMTTNGGGWTKMYDYAFSPSSTYSQFSDGGGGSWTYSNGYFGANSAIGGHNYKMLDSTGSLLFPVTSGFMKIVAKPNVYNTWNSYATTDQTASMSTTVGLCDAVDTVPSWAYNYYYPRLWTSVTQRFASGTFATQPAGLNAANKSSDKFFLCLAPNGWDGGNGFTYTPAFARVEAYFR